MKNSRQQRRYQLPGAKHVQAIKGVQKIESDDGGGEGGRVGVGAAEAGVHPMLSSRKKKTEEENERAAAPDVCRLRVSEGNT